MAFAASVLFYNYSQMIKETDILVPQRDAPIAMIDALVNGDVKRARVLLPTSPEVTIPQIYDRFHGLLKTYGTPSMCEMVVANMYWAEEDEEDNGTVKYHRRYEITDCPEVRIWAKKNNALRTAILFSDRTTGIKDEEDQEWTEQTGSGTIHLFLDSTPNASKESRRQIWISPNGLRNQIDGSTYNGPYIDRRETEKQEFEGDTPLPMDLSLLMPFADFLERTYTNPPVGQNRLLASFLRTCGSGFFGT